MSRNSTYRPYGVNRANQFKPVLYNAFYDHSALGRLIIETFVRDRFGERYYTLPALIFVSIILFVIPLKFIFIGTGHGNVGLDFLKGYATWYIFLFFLVRKGLQHIRVIDAENKTFEYGKLSTFCGYINPIFLDIKIKGKKATLRQIECLLEPAGFFIAGIVLWLCGQGLGILFIVCSLIYAFSYWAEYEAGTQMILNYIDEMIWRKQIEEAFVQDKSIFEMAGVGIRGEKPSNQVTRQEVYNQGFKTDEPVDVK